MSAIFATSVTKRKTEKHFFFKKGQTIFNWMFLKADAVAIFWKFMWLRFSFFFKII